MTSRTSILLLCALLSLLSDVQAKGGDSVVSLQGKIRDASISAEMVAFSFTGQFSFSFFTAAHGDPARKRIDLKFDVLELPIQIPKFGSENDCKGGNFGPFCVSFANAAKYVREAAASGELVDVTLFRPTLTYGVGGVIERAACTHAHVIPKRYDIKDFDIGDLGPSNNRLESVRDAHPTRNGEAPLLAAQAGR
jgi:hypothetical protein